MLVGFVIQAQQIDFDHEIVVDLAFASDRIRSPKLAVGQHNPLDSLVCGVVYGLRDV